LSVEASGVAKTCSRSPEIVAHDALKSVLTIPRNAHPLAAIVIGFGAGGVALVLGQYALSVARSPIVRPLIRLLFVVPAARAGYDVTLALAHFGIPLEWWRESLAMLGAIAVGWIAWSRVSILTEPALSPGVAFGPAQPPIGATTKGR
jgi:hypothetical protein